MKNIALVTLEGVRHETKVAAGTTLGAFKTSIGIMTNIAPANQMLLPFNGIGLDACSTMGQWFDKAGCDDGVIAVIPKGKCALLVKSNDLKICIIEFKPEDKISDLKDKLAAVKGCSPDQQALLFRGQQLSNEQMVKDSNIQHGAILHLIVRVAQLPSKVTVPTSVTDVILATVADRESEGLGSGINIT